MTQFARFLATGGISANLGSRFLLNKFMSFEVAAGTSVAGLLLQYLL